MIEPAGRLALIGRFLLWLEEGLIFLQMPFSRDMLLRAVRKAQG